jgi:hypothetical protein
MVILCDFKLRKFQRRLLASDEQIVPRMSQIEDAIYRAKTKLNAALARSRIKSRVQSIDWLLPASIRMNDRLGSRQYVTCWVNFIKARTSRVQSAHIRSSNLPAMATTYCTSTSGPD